MCWLLYYDSFKQQFKSNAWFLLIFLLFSLFQVKLMTNVGFFSLTEGFETFQSCLFLNAHWITPTVKGKTSFLTSCSKYLNGRKKSACGTGPLAAVKELCNNLKKPKSPESGIFSELVVLCMELLHSTWTQRNNNVVLPNTAKPRHPGVC